MKILVTGGAGFIGSHLVTALLNAGHDVTVLDDLSSGRFSNLDGLPIEFIQGSVSDFEAVKTAVSHIDLIFHQAAFVSVPRSIVEPELNHASNITGTFHVFEAARQAGVRRIVYASSAAVYGDLPALPKQESDPLAPSTPYAMAKRSNELLAAVYTQQYGIDTIGLRYMNVFGPRQDPTSPYSGVLSIFCQAAITQKPIQIYGDGEQTRDFVFVDDVVQANLLAGFRDLSRPVAASVYNVGSGLQTSLNEIVQMVGQLNGRSLQAHHIPERASDIKHSVADVGLIAEELGFGVKTAVYDGLKQTLDWFKSDTE